MADSNNQISLASGTILKVTPLDGNPNAVGVITGTQEPFRKVFRNGILVQEGPGTGVADINCDLEVSGSLIVENDIRLSNIYTYTGTSAGSTTLTESDFGKASVMLISPSGGETVTIQLPRPTISSNKGRLFIIKKVSANGTVTIDPTFSDQIDGVSSVSATANHSFIQVLATGDFTYDYIIIANNGFS